MPFSHVEIHIIMSVALLDHTRDHNCIIPPKKITLKCDDSEGLHQPAHFLSAYRNTVFCIITSPKRESTVGEGPDQTAQMKRLISKLSLVPCMYVCMYDIMSIFL